MIQVFALNFVKIVTLYDATVSLNSMNVEVHGGIYSANADITLQI